MKVNFMMENRIKKLILCIVMLVMLLIPSIASADVSKLHVEGTKLVSESGKTVQLKGISTHGINWYPEYINDECFRQLKKEWKCNVIRIAMYTEEYNGYCNGADKAEMRKLVSNAVFLAEKYDMYVIIDWHILSDGNPNKNVSSAKAFFNTMSKKYADSDNVIYEICNEPNGGTSWTDIKKYAGKVIPVIRENDPDSVIIVGTPTWSQDVDKAAASSLKYKNVMYAFHFYADTHKESYRDKLEKAVKSGLPVFVSEYGICDASGNGNINTSQADKWMSLLDKYKVSSCMWNLSNKNESSSVIKPSCKKTGNFRSSDLSASGKWLVKMLGGTSSGIGEPVEDVESSQAEIGDIHGNDAGVEYNFVMGNSWESEGKTYYQGDIIVTNKTGKDITSWKVRIPLGFKTDISQIWCAFAETEDDAIVISNESYNGSLADGASVSGIGIIFSVKILEKVKIEKIVNHKDGIYLKWNAVSDAEGYKVYRKKGTGSYVEIADVSSNIYTDKCTSNGSRYTYKAVAYAGSLTSGYTAYEKVRLVAPKVKSSSYGISKGIKLRWTRNDKATKYQVKYSKSSSFASSKKVWTSDTWKTVKKLKPCKTYYVKVRAYKAGCYSAWSDAVKIKTK